MPPFPFLFELQATESVSASNVLRFPEGSLYAPSEGLSLVPTRRAKALVEYLLSMKFDYNLPEAIISNNESTKK